jgi:hypothetical protein
MSNRSSCRVLRFLGMDGFLGFKCGPSCSEKQHNKEIKALIDAIDDLLAYDSKTKKELGAKAESFEVSGARIAFSAKLDGIKDMANDLRGTHIPEPFMTSDQPRAVTCEQVVQGIGATVDSARERFTVTSDDLDRWGLEEDRETFQSQRDILVSIHARTGLVYRVIIE